MAVQTESSLASISESLHKAESHFLTGCYYQPEDIDRNECEQIATHYLESAYIELLVLTESLGLQETYRQVLALYHEARSGDFIKSKMGPEEPYLVWADKARKIADAVASVQGQRKIELAEVDGIKEILKRAVYVICDAALFGSAPAKESDVHDRLEGILKCHFGDLKRKPSLSKPIKNFEPDTGIPSIRTLIEYKYITTKAEAKRVVDEILADTSGYRSLQWKSLLFVIYETSRLFHENEWMDLLRECDLSRNYEIIVLSGTPSS